ncbi:exosortase family protein XrtF [Bergeyella porcorum]|uniref:exosortase family protein XrtF n=1 Tax=Bergeyella porcorum TaxID=1735111 RepID=UPI0035E9542E
MFDDFKPVLKILLRFLVIYLMLLGSYQLYLNDFEVQGLDPISRKIADNVVVVQNFLGYPSGLYDMVKEKSVYFYISGQYPTKMVEGCNAVSIMILFLSFIFAFYKGWKTFVFSVIGLAILYILNVLRIAGLNVIYVENEAWGNAAHDYAFPAIIYGGVVILWLVWIKFYVLKNE